MSDVDDAIERAEKEYAAHESGILLSNRDVADRLLLAAEVKRLREENRQLRSTWHDSGGWPDMSLYDPPGGDV